jgi:hypothetical protein
MDLRTPNHFVDRSYGPATFPRVVDEVEHLAAGGIGTRQSPLPARFIARKNETPFPRPDEEKDVSRFCALTSGHL